ncbi:hypothetical protein SBOR_3646 [Sclerotinia borealis F-4128]|uniref:Uncharacterized protein n=1 Tax=Sclerotinia borealis (strain F-4128) TaxID=1432307 RepID=W9CMS5_SCLBF|nr:hypothetical protein SBOR_3646 [Sclerotinia borealis F-4128]
MAACSIDADQAILIPGHSLVGPSSWWKEAAKEVLETSSDFDLVIRTVKFIPLPDPQLAAALLSKRHETWIKHLFPGGAIEGPLQSFDVEQLVASIKGDRPRLQGGMETEKLDNQMQWEFCRIKFSEWIAWICGVESVNVSHLLDTLFNFRNALAEHARQHEDFLEKLGFPSQQPLPRWILSTAIKYDVSSEPSDALVSFFKPIAQQFEEPSQQFKERYSSISALGQKLAILHARFTSKVVCHTDPDWSAPFSTNFSLWERIQKKSPQELADPVVGDGCTKDLARTSSDFADEVFAYLSADKNLTSYIMDLAELCLALQRWKYQPQQSSWVWDTINPKDNFSGCKKYARKTRGCLPFLFTEIVEVQRANEDRADKIIAVLAMIAMHLNSDCGKYEPRLTSTTGEVESNGAQDGTHLIDSPTQQPFDSDELNDDGTKKSVDFEEHKEAANRDD